ncbi:DUF2177 family protein [Aestuariivirga litoralis]|nr:DUF2177 family protein [Aestuariivirga litoralis]
MQYIYAYLLALVVYAVIDFVWLGLIGRGLYVSEMGDALRPDLNWAAAVAFYLVYALGLVFLAISPGVAAKSVMQAASAGAVLGLVAYGTYDLTGLAVLKGFSTRIALVDLAWGTLLSAAVAAGVTKILT